MEYSRCKACGYVIEARRVRDRCPACGAPAAQFEPYVERLGEKRLRILRLGVHPVIVHVPQAFAAFLTLLCAALAVLGPGSLRDALYDTTLTLATVLPLSVVAAFAAGLFDGKVRFRRVTTPLLVRKMVAGVAFLALSFAAAVLALSAGLDEHSILAPFAALEALALGAGAVLGAWGSSLTGAALPG